MSCVCIRAGALSRNHSETLAVSTHAWRFGTVPAKRTTTLVQVNGQGEVTHRRPSLWLSGVTSEATERRPRQIVCNIVIVKQSMMIVLAKPCETSDKARRPGSPRNDACLQTSVTTERNHRCAAALVLVKNRGNRSDTRCRR
ncbi:hypothetical protein J6590_034805 [Homalodisca vitripennis]|nr:hypothetical protein J6590_034805 [Homalodisca vitripennis]